MDFFTEVFVNVFGTFVRYFWILRVDVFQNRADHSFFTHLKFSEKLTFLPPPPHIPPIRTHMEVLTHALLLPLFIFSFIFACKYCKYGDRVRKIIPQYMKFDQ